MASKVALIAVLLFVCIQYGAPQGTAEACTVVHYLLPGEYREFQFGSGPQFAQNLSCVFVFVGPMTEHLTLQVSDMNMASGNDSCSLDSLRVFNYQSGNLSLSDTICGATNSTPVNLSSNIAVVTYESHESTTPRYFVLVLTSSAGGSSESSSVVPTNSTSPTPTVPAG